MRMISHILIFAMLSLFVSCGKIHHEWILSSPGNQLNINVSVIKGEITYSLKRHDRQIIEPSSLGIDFEEASFSRGLKPVSSNIYHQQEESYAMMVGKQTIQHAKWNELHLSFENPDGGLITMQFRLFNDGLAFRYVIEEPAAATYTLKEEHTTFQLPLAGKKWIHPYDTLAPWSPAYETFYENGIAIGTPSDPNKNGWAFPALFLHDENWLLITEAGLGEQYVGMHLTDRPDGGNYTLRLPEEGEAEGRCGAQPTIQLPFSTPWRVIIASNELHEIVESNLVFHVSEPSVIDDKGWIRPGRAAWSWWSENDSPKDYEKLKEYIDFTADMGWEYFLVDANWNNMTGGSLEQLTRYASEKKVGILAWYNSGGSHNVITEEPRDLMDDTATRRAEFKRISEWGVKGIKVDFFQSDKDCVIRLYHEIMKDAIDYQLLVNFHGSTLPKGWERTYPHLVSMEAVRGCEAYIFDSRYPEFAPFHNTILVFTRNVVGSMDYTPVAFSDNRYPHKTTFAHELALAVLFESGIQHFADNYRSYLAQPGFVIDYLKQVPVVWDETRFVDGYPGEFAILARRSGDTWYVSGINGLNDQREISIPVNFTGTGSYHVDLIADGDSDRSFSRKTFTLSADDELEVDMRPRGGFAAVFRPAS